MVAPLAHKGYTKVYSLVDLAGHQGVNGSHRAHWEE